MCPRQGSIGIEEAQLATRYLVEIRDDFALEASLINSQREVKHISNEVFSDFLLLGNSSPTFLPGGQDADLNVRIAATHAGRLTLNGAVYVGALMDEAAITYVNPFGKPILLNHDINCEPLGRVRSARFVKSKMDSTIKAMGNLLNRKTNKLDKYLDAARALSQTDQFSDINFEGTGHLEIIAGITSDRAAANIERGVYLTGSTSVVAKFALCSICGQNFVTDGWCEHKPGAHYSVPEEAASPSAKEGTNLLSFAIVGPGTYTEYSFVNKPADMLSKIEEAGISITDSEDGSRTLLRKEGEVETWKGPRSSVYLWKDKTLSDSEIYDIISSDDAVYDDETIVGDEQMSDELHKEDKQVTTEVVQDSSTEGTAAQESTDVEVANADEAADDTTNSIVEDVSDNDAELATEEDQADDVVEDAAPTEDASDDNEDDEETDEDLDAFNKLDISGDLSEEDVALIDRLLNRELEKEDAKLTTAQRKKLPSSAFCGPNRSFPVPDCCLTAETKIPLLDGSEVAISDLIDRDDVWVYGYSLDQKAVVPVRVSKVWKAVENAPIYKIVLDNGEEIRCTGNHPFLTRDGDYTRADELEEGTSLMPFYTKYQTQHDGTGGYLMIYQPWYGVWEYAHKLIARESIGRVAKKNEVVHHKDGNRHNNLPDNLEYVDRLEHLKRHSNTAAWTSGAVLLASVAKQIKVSEYRLQKAVAGSPYNHTVVSVELDGYEDAYDLEVPATNNFALSAGIFVHNSHYAAAKRLLGRYKGPGDKSKILACINRKGKALGCPGAKKSNDNTASNDCLLPYLNDDELKHLYVDLRNEAANRELVLDSNCPECQANHEAVVALEEKLADLSDSKDDLTAQVNALRRELLVANTNLIAAEDNLNDFMNNLAEALSVLGDEKATVDSVLSGEYNLLNGIKNARVDDAEEGDVPAVTNPEDVQDETVDRTETLGDNSADVRESVIDWASTEVRRAFKKLSDVYGPVKAEQIIRENFSESTKKERD